MFLHKLKTVALLFGVAVSSVAADVVVSDKFTLDGKARNVGSTLANCSPQEGAGKWKVPKPLDNTVFSTDGKISNGVVSAPKAVQACIDIPEPETPVTVQADVVTNSSGWVSVGFQSVDTAPWFSSENVLFALLQPDGKWVVFKNGQKLVKLASGNIENYDNTKPAALGLKYDPTTTKATVLIDEKDVSGPIVTSLDKNVEIGAAGFYIYTLDTTQPGVATVGHFKVSRE